MIPIHLPALVAPAATLPAAEAARTVRQSRLPELGELGQRRLTAARVLVVGAGGLGSPAMQYLAGAGVGTIGVIDDDVIEISNLHRQVIHGVSGLGTAKVDSAAARLREIRPGIVVQTYRERLTEENLAAILSGYDLVLDGTDNFGTRYLVADACEESGVPLIWASVLRFDAQVSLFWSRPPTPAPSVGLRDLFPEPPAPGTVPSCAEAGVIGALCGVVGSMMAAEAVKLICGIGQVLLGRVAVVDLLTMRIHEVPIIPAAAPTHTPPIRGATRRAVVTDDHCRPAPDAPLDLAQYRALRARSAERPVVLLDVREPSEVLVDALPGAVNLPVSVITQSTRGADPGTVLAEALTEAGIESTALLVTYCAAGVRAARATRILTSQGRVSLTLSPDAVTQLRAEVRYVPVSPS